MAIVIAVGALYYFDVLDTSKYVTQSCNTGPQLECLEVAMYTNGSVDFRIRNNHPVNLNINLEVEIAGTPEKLEDEPISSGEVKTLRLDMPFSKQTGEVIDMNIEIKFGTGPPTYKVEGSATAKIIPS